MGIVPVALLDVLRSGVLVHAQDDVERLSGRGEGPLPLLLHPSSLAVSLPPVDLSERERGALSVIGDSICFSQNNSDISNALTRYNCDEWISLKSGLLRASAAFYPYLRGFFFKFKVLPLSVFNCD